MPAFRLLALTGLVTAPIAIGLVFVWPVAGASDVLAVEAQLGDAGSAREAYARARRAAADAERRAQRFDREATEAREAADRSAREAAALAARIQQAEADILAAQARLALITDQRRVLDAWLAEQQQPLVRLTAALQNMARRPLVLSALQPGTLKDTVYARAVLEATMPEIRDRTVGLRSELARGRELEQEASETLASLRMDEGLFLERRRALETLATQQRLASREVRQVAQRESERALALSENARDLNSLVGELGRAGALRAELAALPGPLARPPRPGASQVLDAKRNSPTPRPTALAAPLQLPVQGRTLAGFGESDAAGLPVTGLRLAPSPGAQVIAPAAGRVAFAGPYRGYGQVVIVEHGNGFTSLVTGLARADVAAGDAVIGGSPIGTATRRDAAITLELRRDGQPVNPLHYM